MLEKGIRLQSADYSTIPLRWLILHNFVEGMDNEADFTRVSRSI